MAYATQQNMIDRYGSKEMIRLTDRASPPAGAIDAAVMSQALASADALANSYIAARVTTPLDPVPLALTDAVCAIARYKLFTGVRSQDVTDDFNGAVKWLAAVGAGAAQIGDEGAPPPEATSGSPQISAPDRVFSRDTLKGF